MKKSIQRSFNFGKSGAAKSLALGVALTLSILPSISSAQASEQDLSSAANDPTASLMSFQLQDFYVSDFHNLDNETQNTVQFRAAIPFTLGGTNNIARLTLPYFTDTPSGGSGLSDMTLFNLTVFEQDWGRWGVGAVALLPTGEDGLSAEKWGLGPAVGFSAQEGWGLWGLFNQNILTVAGDDDRPDVNISTLQPILNVPIGSGWSFGFSEMTFVYDWDANKFTSLPLGLKVSKLTNPGAGRIPVQYQLSYERDFYDEGVAPRDTVGVTVKFLVPK
ncbi:MAG: hypothetical protein AAGI10_00735 [Pseudomonadota bacterium]